MTAPSLPELMEWIIAQLNVSDAAHPDYRMLEGIHDALCELERARSTNNRTPGPDDRGIDREIEPDPGNDGR